MPAAAKRHDPYDNDATRCGMGMGYRDRFRLDTFVAGRRAATAMEYVLIGAGISIAIIGGVALIGGSVKGLFDTVSTAVGGG
jgi:Flp pilus assembly pilin Flp